MASAVLDYDWQLSLMTTAKDYYIQVSIVNPVFCEDTMKVRVIYRFLRINLHPTSYHAHIVQCLNVK